MWVWRLANSLVTPESSVMIDFLGEYAVKFDQELSLVELVSLDFAFHFLVFGDCFFHAVLGKDLRVAPVVYVIKDLERNLNVTNLMAESLNFLKIFYHGLNFLKSDKSFFCIEKGKETFSKSKPCNTYLVENRLTLWLEVTNNYTNLTDILNRFFQVFL